MIDCLYDCFKHWAKTGSVYIYSDTHFEDHDCLLMDPNWIAPEKQIEIINKKAFKGDTLILLGDIGNPEWAKKLKAKKILITGNHDIPHLYKDIFDEIYTGPVFIAPKILLSHEPVFGLHFCVNIHGHDHGGEMRYDDRSGAKHINVAANVCGWTPINLKEEIKKGLFSKIKDIHRVTIDGAVERKMKKEETKTNDENFTFLDTSDLRDNEIFLKLIKTRKANLKEEKLPSYHFSICLLDGTEVGACRLRIGNNEKMKYFGHVGYDVIEEFRGHKYAEKATKLLFQLAREHDMDSLLLICDEDNVASYRTCENLGSKLMGIVETPDKYDKEKSMIRIYQIQII